MESAVNSSQGETPTVRSLIRGLLGRTGGIHEDLNRVAASVLGEYPPDPSIKWETPPSLSLLDEINQLSATIEDISAAVAVLVKEVGIE